MVFQSTKCILDTHVFFEQASELERSGGEAGLLSVSAGGGWPLNAESLDGHFQFASMNGACPVEADEVRCRWPDYRH